MTERSRPEPLTSEVRRLVVGNTLSALGTGFTLPFLLIYLTRARGLSVATAGYAIAGLGLVALVCVPVMGTLTDRFGAWRVLLVSLCFEALGTAGLALVSRPWHAFVVLAVLAVGHAGNWPSGVALIAALVPAERRPRVYAVRFALLNLGIGIGGAVSGLIVDVHRVATFQAVYVIDSLSFLAYVAMLATIRHVDRPPPPPEPVEGDPGTSRRAAGYRDVAADRVFLRLCGVTLLLAIAGYGQINAGLPAFVSDVAHVSTRAIGFAFAANTTVIVAAQLLVERHLQGRRRTRALAAVAVFWAVSWAVIGAAALVSGRASAAFVIAGLGIFGIGETIWAPTGASLVNDIAPPHLRGRYNALASVTWQLSAVIGPIVAGIMLGGGLATEFIALLVGLLALVVVLAIRVERHLSPMQNGIRDAGLDLMPPASPATAARASPG
jgi:MFS family permease